MRRMTMERKKKNHACILSLSSTWEVRDSIEHSSRQHMVGTDVLHTLLQAE